MTKIKQIEHFQTRVHRFSLLMPVGDFHHHTLYMYGSRFKSPENFHKAENLFRGATPSLVSLIPFLCCFQTYVLPLTLHKINNMNFTPKKDYTANRLVSGVLQLSDGTHLVLDETAMEAGQLDANGMVGTSNSVFPCCPLVASQAVEMILCA